MKNIATTPEQKREVVEKLLKVWMKYPELRLGQLMSSALSSGLLSSPASYGNVNLLIYNIEDFDLVKFFEYFDSLRSDAD